MNKTLLSLVMLLVSTISCCAQIYSKTKFLMQSYNKITGKIAFDESSKAVLKDYYPPTTVITIAELNKNPFFQDLFEEAAGAGIEAFAGKAVGKLGGVDVTTITDGIAQFMIKRAKEELTIAFFNRFKKCVEQNPEIQVMFPKTTATLENLLDFQYPEMLPALQKAFIDDLNLLPIHLDDVLELPRYRTLLTNFPEVKIAIHCIRIVSELESKDSHPYTVINDIAGLEEWDDAHASVQLKNAGNTIRLGSIFSMGLMAESPSANDPWISAADVKALIKDKVAFKVFLGLLYQQVENVDLVFPGATPKQITLITSNGEIHFGDIMRDNKDNLILFQTKLQEFIELTEELRIALKEINATPNHTPEDFHKYIGLSIDVIEYSFDVVRIFNADFMKEDYIKMVRSGNDLYLNIARKEYSAAISNALDIFKQISDATKNGNVAFDEKQRTDKFAILSPLTLSSITDEKAKKVVKDIKDAGKLSSDNEKALREHLPKISGLTPEQKQQLGTTATAEAHEFLDNVIPEISKYGLFIANVASAKTPDEVEKVIEAAVLPVGSSSIKKNSRWNMAVQSYLGAYVGLNDSDVADRAWSDKFGVIAPIGISLSYGFQKAGSASLFVPLLDLGAIVDYKLKYDTIKDATATTPAVVNTSKTYTTKLGQIFSPGVYIVYGFFGNLPLSLGFGGQYGPGLSKIDSNGTAIVDNPGWRVNAFLAVDIPLFNIFNRGYNKKLTVKK